MLLGYGFEPRRYTYALTLAGLVMIVSLSMDSLLAHEKTCLMTKTIVISPEVWASAISKACGHNSGRAYFSPPHSRRQKKAAHRVE